MSVKDRIKSSSTARGVVNRGRRERGKLVTARLDGRTGLEGDLIDAVRAALRSEATPEEQGWIDRIEAKRAELATLTDPVVFPSVDGSAEATRTVGVMTASSKPPRWAYLLFRLIRAGRPEHGLELGACVGISAAYQAAAMHLNDAGHLMSLEGAPTLAKRSADTQLELGLDRAEFRIGVFTDTLPGVLAEMGTVDWAFIDGHHQEAPTLEYTELILAHARPGTVLVYDDLAHSPGVTRAWNKLKDDSRFGLVLDLRAIGVCVVGGAHDYVRIPYA